MNLKNLIMNIPQACLIIYCIVLTGSRKSLIASTMVLSFWGVSNLAHTMKYGNKIRISTEMKPVITLRIDSNSEKVIIKEVKDFLNQFEIEGESKCKESPVKIMN